MYPRFVERRAEEALADTPVVLIVGPRRAGKTTLARKMAEEGRTYVTLDDRTVHDAALSDPNGFIRGLDRAIIDEIQRAPDLLLAIKRSVDEDYRPGRFLLTGSANVMTLPRVADSLAGRIETIRMLPLARAEIAGTPPTFLERLFEGRLERERMVVIGDDLVRLALLGGFPEAIERESERRRQAWARSYLTSVLTLDLRDIAEMERLADLPKFVRLLAEYSGRLVNYSQFGSEIDVSHKTGQRYVAVLEQVFLVSTLQPWYIAALVHECAEAHRQDAEAAFPRFRPARCVARIELRSCQGRPQRARRVARELRVLGGAEAHDRIGPALGRLPFPRPAEARSRHRAGTRGRDDCGDRGQGGCNGDVQRFRRTADPGRSVQGTFRLRRRSL